MLPKKNRLLKSEDFKNTSSQGSYFSFQNLSLKFKKNTLLYSRIGFSIGKTLSPKAVERNRVKRVLRESFRQFLPEIVPGFDIVVYFKRDNQSNVLIDSSKTVERIEILLIKTKLFNIKK
ncbi:MAG: ribonuclease P protein component [Candidatus Moranbacteria bacterium]|jgi:ribonuclease P protein component|nr:ribonuclease P protein component [Candidatus Moranbacteria bacterium]